MLRRFTAFLILLCSILVITGCATIITGTKQDIGFFSRPKGASVSINGKPCGKTPMAVELKRDKDYSVKIEMEGYEPSETVLTKKFNGWVWGNILIGGLIGLAIDMNSGAMYILEPEDVMVTLKRSDMTYLHKKDTLYVAVVFEADPAWRKIGALTQARDNMEEAQ